MSKKLLVFIIVLVGIALSGIIYVQLYYIKNTYIQNERNFDQNVNAAVQNLIEKLELKETVERINYELRDEYEFIHHETKVVNPMTNNLFVVDINDTIVQDLIISENITSSDVNWVVVGDDDKVKPIQDKNRKKSVKRETHVFTKGASRPLIKGRIETSYEYNIDKNNVVTIKQEVLDKKTNKIKSVIKRMVTETDEGLNIIRKKLKYNLIDSLLKNSLLERDVNLNYEYAVISANTDEKLLPQSENFDSIAEHQKYIASLFPNDIIPKSEKLVIYFPDRKNHLIKSLSFLLPSSLIFSLIIIVAFSISIMMVIRQKKISDVKSDFINNMTHEFKTPIATISLAADSIINPKVIDDQQRIGHFIGILKDENKRMNKQVERILQMSLLDKRELDFNLVQLDIHSLLSNAVENISMQVNNRKGKIETNLLAENSLIIVDEIHFTNVVNNLLDNALKYSTNSPEIMVSTKQEHQGILISFKDNGIGMNKEAQSKIFDKFYRVSKGNIHNTKGFGLGLSYVKAIIEALGGRINVKSEINKGSRFDIVLPQKHQNNGRKA